MTKFFRMLAILVWVIVFYGACSHGKGNLPGDISGQNRAKTLATGMVPEATTYSMKNPGESEKLPRGHAYAPPMIPHSIDGMMFRKDENPCLDCHGEGVMGAPKIPDSHYMDYAKGVKGDEMHKSRWSCTLCHAPQADVKPLVENTFDD